MYLSTAACSVIAQKTMPQHLTLITLGVKDMKASETFYSETLGWKKTPQSSEAIVFYQLRGIQLCLYPRDHLAQDAMTDPAGTGFPGFTISQYTRSREEVDRLFESIRNQGVKITVSPAETDWGGYRGYFNDPDGYHWEIIHNPHDPAWNEE